MHIAHRLEYSILDCIIYCAVCVCVHEEYHNAYEIL